MNAIEKSKKTDSYAELHSYDADENELLFPPGHKNRIYNPASPQVTDEKKDNQ